MRKRSIEKYLPFTIACLVVILFILLRFDRVFINRFDVFISSLISISMTAIGFIITVATIILGVLDTKIMQRIRKYKGSKLLKQYLLAPVIYGSMLTALLFYLSITVGEDKVISGIVFYASLFLITVFTASLVRIAWLVFILFNRISEDLVDDSKRMRNKEIQGEQYTNS